MKTRGGEETGEDSRSTTTPPAPASCLHEAPPQKRPAPQPRSVPSWLQRPREAPAGSSCAASSGVRLGGLPGLLPGLGLAGLGLGVELRPLLLRAWGGDNHVRALHLGVHHVADSNQDT